MEKSRVVDQNLGDHSRDARRRLLPRLAAIAAALAGLSLAVAPPARRGRPAGPHEGHRGTSSSPCGWRYDDPHWYANIGYYCDDENQKAYAGNGKPDVGKLCKLEPPHRRASRSCSTPRAARSAIRRSITTARRSSSPTARPAPTTTTSTRSTSTAPGLRQLTSGEFDDYEPTYLPDGDIVFVSTRCQRWVNCWMTQVGVLYRCDADGGNIQRLSANTEHDNTPWVLPDGRILYMRWEYVDRSQVEYHHLWTMNPDGTGQTVFYGNMHPGIVMIDAKPIPGTSKVRGLVLAGPRRQRARGHRHDRRRPTAGPDDQALRPAAAQGPADRGPLSALRGLLPGGPRQARSSLLDGAGSTEAHLHATRATGDVHEPRPLVPRPREPVIPPRADRREPTGPAGAGRRLPGPQPGGRAARRDQEAARPGILPKPVNFSGGPDLVSWLGTFTLERVLGTVPVEADGSAYFEVPAGRPLFFVALDEKDLSVKRMQSFTQRAARRSRPAASAATSSARGRPRRSGRPRLLALRRPPSRIEPFAGLPDVLDFPRDIQPILDRHCVALPQLRAARRAACILTGDLGPTLVAQLLQPVRPSPGGRRPQRLGQPAAAHHRQLRQPAAEEARRRAITT